MKKGFTLLETVLAVALLSMCVVGFLQALNVAMLGSYHVELNNAAAELAHSQMEYIQQRDYEPNASSAPNLYGFVPEIPAGFSTGNINTTVSNVSGMDYRAIQQITVNVSYSNGQNHIELSDYKTPRLSSIVGGSQTGWLITDNINMPTIPCNPIGTKWGYYYTFKTGTTTNASGPISVMWQFQTFAIKGVQMYLYGPSGRSQFPTMKGGLIQLAPPTTGCLSVVTSWWGADREICAIEMTGLAPGEYTAYYYNSGLWVFVAWVCLLDVPPSQSTITYIQ